MNAEGTSNEITSGLNKSGVTGSRGSESNKRIKLVPVDDNIKSMGLFLANFSIAMVNAIFVFPVLLVAMVLTRLSLMLAKSLWITVGVPIFYGLGNLVRIATSQKPVRAPIGFVQWLMHAALLASLIVLPLALAGVGVFAGTWVATTAAPWIVTALLEIAPELSFGLVSALGFSAALVVFSIGWPKAEFNNESFGKRLKQTMQSLYEGMLSFFCPSLVNNNPIVPVLDNETQSDASESADKSDTFTGWNFGKSFYNSGCSSNLLEAHQTWRTSLSELTNGLIPEVKAKIRNTF